MMTPETFASRLKNECAVMPGGHVLAAVSGGADSMALLNLLEAVRGQLSLRVSCVHVEHGIRGVDSLADMAFVERVCADKRIPFYAERVDAPEYAKAHGCGLEDAARTLRYEVFERIARQIGADAVALAHHAQDQAETLLLHAARGSDIRGLCGMRWRRGLFIRPLLAEKPEALRAYLTDIGQNWCEDETNSDTAYARNRIRLEVLPALEAAYPGATASFFRLAEAAQRDERYFDRELERLGAGKAMRLVDGLAMELDDCRTLDEALLSRLIRKRIEQAGIGAPGADIIRELCSVIGEGGTATLNLPDDAHAMIGTNRLYLIRKQNAVKDMPIRQAGETQTPFGMFRVREALPGEHGDGRTAQSFDETLLCGAVVTQRREGDAMIPFGRHTSVKLKKLMIDVGVDRPMRNSLPVLRRDDEILWAVGLRPSATCSRDCGGRRLLVEWIDALPM